MIYFCEMVEHPFVKIGYSEAPESRYIALDTASPFHVRVLAERNGSWALEKAVHAACSKFLVKNEWYHDVPEVLEAFFNVFDPFPEARDASHLFQLRKRQIMERRVAFGKQSGVKFRNARLYLETRMAGYTHDPL